MAQPASILNSTGQKLPVHIGDDGGVRLPLLIDDVDLTGVGITPHAGAQAVGTHLAGATFGATDRGVAVLGADDAAAELRPMLVDVTGKPIVVNTPSGGGFTDHSGSITAGGTRQSVMGANTTRKYFLFQNISDITMWLNFGVNAVADQPSIMIPAGGNLVFEAGFVPTTAVDLMGATTGKKFVAKEA